MGEVRTAYLTYSYNQEFTTDQGVKMNGDVTVMGVEHHPFSTPESVVDQKLDSLSPPDDLVREFNKLLVEDGLRWPEAWKKCNFEKRYKEYLENNDEASTDLFRLNMMKDRGDICLVCSCGDVTYEYCIRKIILEFIEE